MNLKFYNLKPKKFRLVIQRLSNCRTAATDTTYTTEPSGLLTVW